MRKRKYPAILSYYLPVDTTLSARSQELQLLQTQVAAPFAPAKQPYTVGVNTVLS